MRLPPSVVSLIESHLGLPPIIKQPANKEISFKAFAANLQPHVPGRPTRSVSSRTRTPPPIQVRKSTSRQIPKRIISTEKLISLEDALERYPTQPQVALGAAHRLLNEQQSAPSTSSRVDHIVKRQRTYTYIIKTFASYPESANVTLASIYQRLVNEDIPPSNVILKIILGTSLKNGTPIMPILRGLIAREALSEEVDHHLLLLVIKGMAREVEIEPKELGKIIDDCLSIHSWKGKEKERSIGFDEVLVESYGRQGDLKGMINLLSRHTNPGKGLISLYLQALTQWIENPTLRKKRRGSLFPRALAKDLTGIYGGAEKLPIEWLNAWMNGERIANNLETALNVWTVINSSRIKPDTTTYSIYLRLIKLLPHDEGLTRLRQVIKSLFGTKTPKMNIELIEHALGAAFTHNDYPLVLFLARQLDYTPDQHLHTISPSARVIDILAAGFIRSQRQPHSQSRSQSDSKKNSNAITIEEWDRVTRLIKMNGVDVTLPLNTPLAGLIDTQGTSTSGDYIGRFKPRSRTHIRASLVKPLIGLLERACLERCGGDEEIFRRVMKEVNAEIRS